MSGEWVPTYSAGDTISVCVVVRSWAAGKGICRIRATFAHEADPTKEIELSDDPASRSHAQVQTEDDVELRGLVVAGDHPVGVPPEGDGRRVPRGTGSTLRGHAGGELQGS